MKTQQIVQASANVIRIVQLKTGDLYKRFDDSSYSDKMKYGIVRNIYNDGEVTYVESTEYTHSYGDLTASLYIMRGDKDVSIFPASLDELEIEFRNAETHIESEIKKKEKEIEEKKKALETTRMLISGELQKQMQSAEFKEMTQSEFNEKKMIAEQKKLQASDSDF